MALTARWWVLWTAMLLAPMVAFAMLLLFPSLDANLRITTFHFWVVSATALAAAAACVLIVSLAESLRETRLIFLGLAFLSIAAIFSVHGLATPGHIHSSFQPELRLSSWLSVLAGAFFVSLSVLDLPDRADEWLKRNGAVILGGATVAMGFYIGMAIASPGWLGFIPMDNRTLQLGVAALIMALLAFSAWRYFQAFLFARLPSQWAMVVALILLMQVQVSLTWGVLWQLSWWWYHATYAVAFIVLFAGWFVEAKRAGSLRVIADALSMRDAIAQLNRGYDQPITELIDAIELKDLYTLGHVRRVAGYAVIIGRELGFSSLDLRSVALAAQMHDIGKIGVPDQILTKPAKLTAEEFDVIKQHVLRGYEIATRVPALNSVAGAIKYHHEHFDGSGYPDGLKGNDIPQLARIVAVADAFDAMTSGRVYQPAVSFDAALAELRRCQSAHFDPACVRAFQEGLRKQPDSSGLLEPRQPPHLTQAVA